MFGACIAIVVAAAVGFAIGFEVGLDQRRWLENVRRIFCGDRGGENERASSAPGPRDPLQYQRPGSNPPPPRGWQRPAPPPNPPSI